MEQRFFNEFFRAAPPEIDVAAIRQEWLALGPQYKIESRRLPIPVWARRGFTESGRDAWDILCQDAESMPATQPFCIYMHIPFCASKCGFCDCYSFRLGPYQSQHIETYRALLAQEMCLWSRLGSLAHRPVSTVHFGGGTPTFLGVVAFSRLVQNCREHFATDARTEWALESTTSELTDEMVHALDGLGFTRLHLGVQSLEDVVRRLSNRREPASEVLRKISKACALGWVVSVDMIYGLPEQSLTGLIHDIQSLADVGVDGFSLYEMQISPRNRRFAERHGLLVEERRFINYFLFQAAAHQLASMGYRKTLFNHFARARDMNLYFTFPKRGEDCVALGTIADGVLGDYHYRHPVYRSYCQSVDETFPGLQAGMRRNAIENRLHPLEVAILSGSFHPALFSEVLGENRAEALLHQWGQSTLVVESAEGLCLTANGSWFAGEMLEQLATRHLPLGDS